MQAMIVSAPRNSKRLDQRSKVAQHKQAHRRTEIDAAWSLPVDRVDQVDHPFVAGRRDLMECAPELVLQADAGLSAAKMGNYGDSALNRLIPCSRLELNALSP
jgi:hypothetical protein